jgi:putative flavoprotein involved in K+ transport
VSSGAAAGIAAPESEAAPPDTWLPKSAGSRLNLAQADVTSIIWATGYRLDNSILDIPVVDEWSYPRHSRGVTEVPGLYAVGLPWLTRHVSATLPGVGPDAEFIAEHIAGAGGRVRAEPAP